MLRVPGLGFVIRAPMHDSCKPVFVTRMLGMRALTDGLRGIWRPGREMAAGRAGDELDHASQPARRLQRRI